MLFSTDHWAIRSHDGVWPQINESVYFKDNQYSLVEKKTDIESYEIVDESYKKTIKKYGNRISYEIRIFDSDDKKITLSDDLSFLEHIDGHVIKFYTNYSIRPYNYQECYIYHIYDDCSRAPIHLIKLFLKRKRLEKLSSTINISSVVYYNCFQPSGVNKYRISVVFTSSFTGIVNVYTKRELGEYSIIANGIDIVDGNNYIDIAAEMTDDKVSGSTVSSLNYIKIESTEDYYIFGEMQFIIKGEKQ